jgi:hypothetical protein
MGLLPRWMTPLVLLGTLAASGVACSAPRPEVRPGWQLGPPLPEPFGELATTTARLEDGSKHLVVVSGIGGLGRVLDRVQLYDPAGEAWREGPPLPAPRHHAAATSLDGHVYVMGGSASLRGSPWEGTPDVWRLDADGRGWTALEPMPEPRWGHRVVALRGSLYVIGGHGPSASVLVYDPHQGWSARAPLPQPRHHLSVVGVGGEIWAIGGRADDGNLARVDVFEPAANRWREGPALPHATSGAAEGVIDGRILIFGGEDPRLLGGGVIDRHWMLDTREATPAWRPAPDPPLAVHGADGAVMEGRMMIVGGAGRHGALSIFSWTPAFQVLDEEATLP